MVGLLDNQLNQSGGSPGGLLQLAGDVIPFPEYPTTQDNYPNDPLDPDSRLRRAWFMRGPWRDMIERGFYYPKFYQNDAMNTPNRFG